MILIFLSGEVASYGVRGPRVLDIGRGPNDWDFVHRQQSTAGEGDLAGGVSPLVRNPGNRLRFLHGVQPVRETISLIFNCF